jgi:hypothetical protein
MQPEKIAELRVKHLEMVQSLITRMAGYGASFKSYCITVTTAIIGFGFTLHRPIVAALALLPVIAFGAADAQYLRVERRFRALFNLVRSESWDAMPSFDINLHSPMPYASTDAACECVLPVSRTRDRYLEDSRAEHAQRAILKSE